MTPLAEDLGVTTVANLMLLHPYSTPETIERAIDVLAGMRRGIFETTQTMVYHGTRLHERIAAEGRLTGNPIRYSYRFDDPVVDRFAQVFVRLRGHAFRDYSAAYRAHEVGLSLSVARHLRPDLRIGHLQRRYEDAVKETNAVGPDGTVADVIGSGGVSVEALDCIRAALEGHEFPCLANREICPEFAIGDC